MTIYVDSVFIPYGRMKMCHMTADTTEELHQMVDMIGVNRRWFQGGRFPHYDICMSKRELAVRFGAKEVDTKTVTRVARQLRNRP